MKSRIFMINMNPFQKKMGQEERREVGVGIGGDLLIYDFHIQKNRSLKL